MKLKNSQSTFSNDILTYEQIVERLTNVVNNHTINNVALSGVDSGNGSSAVCEDLVQTLSFSNHNVLLIKLTCANNSKKSEKFDKNKFGKLLQNNDIDAGGIKIIEITTDMLPKPASPQENELTEIIDNLQNDYNVILWDLPPADKAVQSRMIAQYTQGVIVVVEAGKTRWQTARHAIEHYRFSGGNILGVILNKKKNYIPSWLYRILFGEI